MSSNVAIDPSNLYGAAAARKAGATAPAKTRRRVRALPWHDLPGVLPVLVALLLIVGFGIVAEPLAVKDLPLLLDPGSAGPAHTAP